MAICPISFKQMILALDQDLGMFPDQTLRLFISPCHTNDMCTDKK